MHLGGVVCLDSTIAAYVKPLMSGPRTYQERHPLQLDQVTTGIRIAWHGILDCLLREISLKCWDGLLWYIWYIFVVSSPVHVVSIPDLDFRCLAAQILLLLREGRKKEPPKSLYCLKHLLETTIAASWFNASLEYSVKEQHFCLKWHRFAVAWGRPYLLKVL